jgi:hypothetical protein
MAKIDDGTYVLEKTIFNGLKASQSNLYIPITRLIGGIFLLKFLSCMYSPQKRFAHCPDTLEAIDAVLSALDRHEVLDLIPIERLDGQVENPLDKLEFAFNNKYYLPLSVLVRMVKLESTLLYILEAEALMLDYRMIIPPRPSQMDRYCGVFASEIQGDVSFERFISLMMKDRR